MYYDIDACKFGNLKKEVAKMNDLNKTQYFTTLQKRIPVSQVLEMVYQALNEKGYDPLNQIVGYIMSGDPTYITSHNGARSTIMKVERDEIMEELMKFYIEHKLKG
ncbi:hypothetical protein P261_01903 [Lachnospiraceae bacterium TWA4]|nr:hypothetical protein P261_01903 [Lachnospiraceae bacterium TWA4]